MNLMNYHNHQRYCILCYIYLFVLQGLCAKMWFDIYGISMNDIAIEIKFLTSSCRVEVIYRYVPD